MGKTARGRNYDRWRRGAAPKIAPVGQPFTGTYVSAHSCMCGKRGFISRKDAKTVIREMKRKSGDDALRAYRCNQDERNWHVGHPPPWLRRADDPGLGYAF